MTLRSPKNPQYHGGFTLVISVALLVLLMIIALGTLSLSGIALRSSERSLWQAQARANARCALLLAIGELQRQAGPDQRITAPASIMDSVAETESVQDVGEPLVAGVWSAHQQNPTTHQAFPGTTNAHRFDDGWFLDSAPRHRIKWISCGPVLFAMPTMAFAWSAKEPPAILKRVRRIICGRAKCR